MKAATAEAATAESATAKSDVVDLTREYVSAKQQNTPLTVQIGGEEIEVVVVRKDEYQRAMKKTAEASDDQKIINKARAAARVLNKEVKFNDMMSRLKAQKKGEQEIASVVEQWMKQLHDTFDGIAAEWPGTSATPPARAKATSNPRSTGCCSTGCSNCCSVPIYSGSSQTQPSLLSRHRYKVVRQPRRTRLEERESSRTRSGSRSTPFSNSSCSPREHKASCIPEHWCTGS